MSSIIKFSAEELLSGLKIVFLFFLKTFFYTKQRLVLFKITSRDTWTILSRHIRLHQLFNRSKTTYYFRLGAIDGAKCQKETEAAIFQTVFSAVYKKKARDRSSRGQRCRTSALNEIMFARQEEYPCRMKRRTPAQERLCRWSRTTRRPRCPRRWTSLGARPARVAEKREISPSPCATHCAHTETTKQLLLPLAQLDS